MLLSNPVGWFEIYVQNMERARAFYETVFQIKFQKLELSGIEIWSFPMEYGKMGASGALVKKEGCQSGFKGTMVYFSSEDCATEANRVEAAGGQIEKPKYSIFPFGFITHVVDTEGNMIGIHSPK